MMNGAALILGKSKYQVKAKKSIETSHTAKESSRPKYYDEDFLERKKLKAQSQSGAPGLAIFLTVIIAASVFGVITYVDSTKPAEEQSILPYLRGEKSLFTTSVKIESGDTATMHYTLWADINKDGFFDTETEKKDSSYDRGEPFTTEVTPNAVIYGFYSNLLGMEEGDEKTFELPNNIDENQDGLDDRTGERVQSYTSGDLKDTKLKFYVTIISIEKK